jgi:Fe-S oxidoreductase
LVDQRLKEVATKLSNQAYTIDEFLSNEIDEGNITKEQFTSENQEIKFHCHCQQKAIADSKSLMKVLSLPQNFNVEEINSGCCGMAGSFGYEKEHYDLSMKIGEMKLFPAVRKANADTAIVASGTSCRHQIKDGTGKHAKHPVEILYEAVVKSKC